MRPSIGNRGRDPSWKRRLDRVAVVWIVCAPLLALAAGWLGLLPETASTRPAPTELAAREAHGRDRLPQGMEPSPASAERQRSEPWRTAALRPRR